MSAAWIRPLTARCVCPLACRCPLKTLQKCEIALEKLKNDMAVVSPAAVPVLTHTHTAPSGGGRTVTQRLIVWGRPLLDCCVHYMLISSSSSGSEGVTGRSLGRELSAVSCPNNTLSLSTQPTPPPPPVATKQQYLCQPLLDAVMANIRSPVFNHSLYRTFAPAMAAIHGPPITYVSPVSLRTLTGSCLASRVNQTDGSAVEGPLSPPQRAQHLWQEEEARRR